MTGDKRSRVDSIDLLREGVLITFQDGKCGFYTHELLRETLIKAQEVEEDFEDTAVREAAE